MYTPHLEAVSFIRNLNVILYTYSLHYLRGDGKMKHAEPNGSSHRIHSAASFEQSFITNLRHLIILAVENPDFSICFICQMLLSKPYIF